MNKKDEVKIDSGVVYCVSPEVQELTKDIDCPWCPAKKKQPCYIQISAEEADKLHQNYRLGDSYIPERIHLARWKSNNEERCKCGGIKLPENDVCKDCI